MTHVTAMKARHAETNPVKNRVVGPLNSPIASPGSSAGHGLSKIGGGLLTHQTPPTTPAATIKAK